MMTAVFGDRGIGKTYILAQECYRRYRQGYMIVTNFDFVYSHINYADRSPEDFYKLLAEILTFKERGFETWLLFGGFKHTGIFIAIDEGHLFFSADLWKRYQQEPVFQDVIRVLAQARKLDIEIWYTTQDPAKIDKNWRRYTEDWIRFRPFFPLRKKVLIKHEKYPIYKRELRHLIPLVWMEWHNLDHEHPQVDYTTVTDEDGFVSWSSKSTLLKRRLRRSGWLDSFPYKLYDSNEILSVNIDRPELLDFQNLQKLTVVEHTFAYERFPTFKKILKKIFGIFKLRLYFLRARDEAYPTRLRLESVNIGEIPKGSTKKITSLMPEAILSIKEAAAIRAKSLAE